MNYPAASSGLSSGKTTTVAFYWVFPYATVCIYRVDPDSLYIHVSLSHLHVLQLWRHNSHRTRIPHPKALVLPRGIEKVSHPSR